MRFGIITVSTYVALLVLLLYSVGNECKKKKSSFTFEALMSGMNSKEKEMFKEELNKEVKKFRASQKHHKQKVVVRKSPKKRKLKEKLPKFLPGICDPICAHQCVHGCDFRCCIPDYQQTHKIPRPPPMVVLPGSCSPTCSPTCRPLCTDKCCAGGSGGMFQSSKDLITLDTQSCPAGCSKSCLPRCVISCCVSHMPEYNDDVPREKAPQQETRKEIETTGAAQTNLVQETTRSPQAIIAPPPIENNVEHGPMQQNVVTQMRQNVETQVRSGFSPGITSQVVQGPETQAEQRMAAQVAQTQAAQIRNAQITQASMLEPQSSLIMSHIPKAYFYDNMKCPRMCPDYCAPLCHQGCCVSAKRDDTKIPMIFKPHEMFAPSNRFQQMPLRTPLQIKFAAMASHLKSMLPSLAKNNCPFQCFVSCKPNCEVRCCNLQPGLINKLNFAPAADQALHARDVQSGAFTRPVGYRLAQVMNTSPLQIPRGVLASKLLPQVLPQETAKLTQPMIRMVQPAHKRVRAMDPNAGNYESNVETIHALSKDMITKPEPPKQRKAAPRDHVPKHVNGKKSKHLVARGLISSKVANESTTRAHENQKQSEAKRSPTRAPGAVTKKSFLQTRNPDSPKDSPRESRRALKDRKTEIDAVSEVSTKHQVHASTKTPNKKSSGISHPNSPTIKSNLNIQVRGKDAKKSNLPDKSLTMASVKKDQNKPTIIIKDTDVNQEAKKSIIPVTKETVKGKSSDVKKADIILSPKNGDNSSEKKTIIPSPQTCPHQCSDECAPNCDKPCCNRQIVYEAFHKSQKRSKVKFQLEML